MAGSPYGGPRYFISVGRTTVDLDATDGFIEVNEVGNTMTWPTAAALCTELVSDSANDAAAGTGAQTVRVQGLDAKYEYVTQDVSMNGTTEVDFTTPLRRVWSIEVLTAGSGNTSAGIIDARLAADTVVAKVLAGINYSTLGFFSAPEGTQTRILGYGVSIDGADAIVPDISARLMMRKNNLIPQVHFTLGVQSLGTGLGEKYFKDLRVAPRTDVYITVDTDLDNALVTGWIEFEMFSG